MDVIRNAAATSIVIPAFNEAAAIGSLVSELRAAAARAEHPSLTPNTFLRIAADLGVIGAVTSREGQWVRTEYAYSFERAEPIGASEYAIHPMFHSYLKIKPNRAAVPIGVDQDPLTE